MSPESKGAYSQNGNSEVFPTEAKTYGLMELARGSSPAVTKAPEDTEFTWPHLVFREFLCVFIVVLLLWFISFFFHAPLEEPANPSVTPNPAKAPWYFSSLQELLVYFDPWIAGVVLPSLIVVGLICIPYVDMNREVLGEYNFSRRKFAVTVFTIGLVSWFVLIVIGQSFRGPNWAWYWPWESWEVVKETKEAHNLPNAVGGLMVVGYYTLGVVLPAVILKSFYRSLGLIRYLIVMFFTLSLFAVFAKIFLRLVFGVKYVISTQSFNI